MLPRRDGQGSKEGPKLTAQPHVGGGVGGRTVGGTFRVLETQEQERSVRWLDGQFELTTSVRHAAQIIRPLLTIHSRPLVTKS
jgi:hypothetical protein